MLSLIAASILERSDDRALLLNAATEIRLTAEIADAIIQAADEVLGGALEDNFLLVRVAFV